MSTDTKKRLALAIIDFLQTSVTDGTVPADEKDSVEAAEELIAGAFGVNMNDKKAMSDALGGQSLTKIYEVFEKMKGTRPAPMSSTSTTPPPSTAKPSAPSDSSDEDKKKTAEELKAKGNTAMSQRKYPEAIDYYTQALNVVPSNPIYLSNRAAAYSASSLHERAKADAQSAIDADPTYSKGWSRLGLARFALGDAKGSMEAYEKGIAAEGKGGSDAMRKGYETAKRRVEEDEAADSPTDDVSGRDNPFGGAGGGGMPDLSSLAGMFGGGGGGGGAGGMPGLEGIMNNPMFASMAQKLMSDPQMMSSLMNNPKIKDMMNGAGGEGGGGMPDMASLMSDPTIANMAKNLMGGGGPSAEKK